MTELFGLPPEATLGVWLLIGLGFLVFQQWLYRRNLRRNEVIQERSDEQQDRHKQQLERVDLHLEMTQNQLERQEAMLTRVEKLLEKFERDNAG